MKNKVILLLIAIISIFTFSNVNAKDINNFYAEARQNVRMVDKVIGDSALLGSLIDIDGEIEGIGFVAGGTVNVNGKLDYGFIAGQNVKVVGKIYKSIYIAGQTISFTDDANIGRDAKIVGDYIDLSGRFERNIDVAGSKVIINNDAIVDGDINVYADELEVAANVKLNTLKYNKDAKVKINDSASIKNIEKTKEINNNNGIDISSFVLSIINLIVVLFVFSLLLPKAIDKTDSTYESKSFNYYAKSTLLGLLFIICTPIIVLLLLASYFGTSLGFILLALYLVLLYLSYGLAAYIFGDLIFNKLFKLNINRFLIIAMGITLIKLLTLIPIIGGLITIICVSIGVYTMWELVKKDENEKINKDNKKFKEKTKLINKKNDNKNKKRPNKK